MRAGCLAFSAADAVHAVGIFPDGNIELTGLLAGCTAYAFFGIYFNSVQGNLIEKPI